MNYSLTNLALSAICARVRIFAYLLREPSSLRSAVTIPNPLRNSPSHSTLLSDLLLCPTLASHPTSHTREEKRDAAPPFPTNQDPQLVARSGRAGPTQLISLSNSSYGFMGEMSAERWRVHYAAGASCLDRSHCHRRGRHGSGVSASFRSGMSPEEVILRFGGPALLLAVSPLLLSARLSDKDS